MKTFILPLIALLTISTSAFAETMAEAYQRNLQGMSRVNSDGPRGNPVCTERYQALQRDGVLNIVWGLGYADNSPGNYVFELAYEALVTRTLLAPCTPGLNLCGFRRSPQDPNLYLKSTRNLSGSALQVELKIVKGSLSVDNAFNTSDANRARQQASCEAARAEYARAIENGAEVVLYSGHARDGAGPDFCPPVRRADGHTNYTWYHQNKIGKWRMINAMQTAAKAKKPNQLVGLYACYTRRHFEKNIAAALPRAGFIGTDVGPSLIEVYHYAFGTIDSLLAMRCQQGLRESLDVISPHAVMVNVFDRGIVRATP